MKDWCVKRPMYDFTVHDDMEHGVCEAFCNFTGIYGWEYTHGDISAFYSFLHLLHHILHIAYITITWIQLQSLSIAKSLRCER